MTVDLSKKESTYINIKYEYMHTMMAATEDSFDIPGHETFMASQTMRPCAWKIKGLAALVLKMRYPGPRPAWTASLSMMVMMSPACRCRVDDVDVCFDPGYPITELGLLASWCTFLKKYLFGGSVRVINHFHRQLSNGRTDMLLLSNRSWLSHGLSRPPTETAQVVHFHKWRWCHPLNKDE